MRQLWKPLLPIGLVLALGGFIVGALIAGASGEPRPRPPVEIGVTSTDGSGDDATDPSGTTSPPASTPPTGATPTPKAPPATPKNQQRDDKVEVVRPKPGDRDDDDDDRYERDDDADDGDDD